MFCQPAVSGLANGEEVAVDAISRNDDLYEAGLNEINPHAHDRLEMAKPVAGGSHPEVQVTAGVEGRWIHRLGEFGDLRLPVLHSIDGAQDRGPVLCLVNGLLSRQIALTAGHRLSILMPWRPTRTSGEQPRTDSCRQREYGSAQPCREQFTSG